MSCSDTFSEREVKAEEKQRSSYQEDERSSHGVRRLTFDLSGVPKARPLEGRVGRHLRSGLGQLEVVQTGEGNR